MSLDPLVKAMEKVARQHAMDDAVAAERESMRVALERIKIRASSDAPAEELEDAQRDLRHIYTIACDALSNI